MTELIELRILPPLAIARMGNADEPMENYDFSGERGESGVRKLIFTESLSINNGITEVVDYGKRGSPVKPSDFKTAEHKVKPVAPFLELWGIFQEESGERTLKQVTPQILIENGVSLDQVKFEVEVANRKIYRRTNKKEDIIEPKLSASSIGYSPKRIIQFTAANHDTHQIDARADNFQDADVTIWLGSLQVFPSADEECIRFRFTPGFGRLYQHGEHGLGSPNRQRIVLKGDWPNAPSTANDEPKEYPMPNRTIQAGMFDDSCDCLIQLFVEGRDNLNAEARVVSGPPDFSPDTQLFRSVLDEFEQYLLGPTVSNYDYPQDVEGNKKLVTDIIDILQRMADTVFLTDAAKNAKKWYDDNTIAGVSGLLIPATVWPRHKYLFDKALKIFENGKQTINTKKELSKLLKKFHERFREYTYVPSDIAEEEVPWKMPYMMRGSDFGFLTLTDRQRDKFRLVIGRFEEADSESEDDGFVYPKIPPVKFDPNDIMGQLKYRPDGNQPSTSIASAIGNCMPGLEMDLRGLWQRLLRKTGSSASNDTQYQDENDWILHDTRNLVLSKPGDQDGGRGVSVKLFDPNEGTQIELHSNDYSNSKQSRDRFNRLSELIWKTDLRIEIDSSLDGDHGVKRSRLDTDAKLTLEISDDGSEYQVNLNELIDPDTGSITRGHAGELTHGLCSPWQYDFRDCRCMYWSANRPDYINGDNPISNWENPTEDNYWMYTEGKEIKYDDLFDNWQGKLKFVIQGKDED